MFRTGGGRDQRSTHRGLSGERLKRLVGRKGIEVRVFDEIDSTNSEARRMLANGFAGEGMIISDCQTAGRGRQGKAFYSPAGEGIYMTVILRPDADAAGCTLITSAAAVAAAAAIEELCGIQPEIKWVNDIYIGGKKAAGILTEAISQSGGHAVIVGTGINLTTGSFPDGLRDKACCIGSDIPREELAAKAAKELFRLCDALPDTSYLSYYRERSCVIGHDIVFIENGTAKNAYAEGIDAQGALEVILESGERRRLCGGEITVRARQP